MSSQQGAGEECLAPTWNAPWLSNCIPNAQQAWGARDCESWSLLVPGLWESFWRHLHLPPKPQA